METRRPRSVVQVLVVVLLLVGAGADEEDAVQVLLSVVSSEPRLSLALAAAAEAGLRAVGAQGQVVALPAEPGEPLAAPAQVCAAARDGVHAVIGGAEGDVTLASAAAARAGVPLLLVGEGLSAGAEALRLHPPPELALRAARELAIEKGWQSVALLHAGSAAPVQLLAPDDDELTLVARPLPPPQEEAPLRDLLLVLKKAGFVNFVVSADSAHTALVLDAAQRVGLLSAAHSYVLTALDMHTQPLANYSHGGANITALMMFDPDLDDTRRATDELMERLADVGGAEAGEDGYDFTPHTIPTALLLAYDAAALTGRALLHLQLPGGAGGDCASGEGAFHADTLLNYLRANESSGVTGALTWEADGERRGAVLQVRELSRGGRLEPAGTWSPDGKVVSWGRAPRPVPVGPADSMVNRTFNVLIAMNDPYVMRRESTKRLSGNDRYEGFCIELIEKLAEQLNFNYTFIEQEDRKYGNYDAQTGEWNGMLRRLMDDENMHFAITDLTITEEREKVVDFTTPFMNLGIAILFRKPKPPEPRFFAFLLPFSSDVWVCLGVAYVLSSLVLFCVGRLCPEEWQNPYPCVEEPAFLENQFTLGNAFWFNAGAVLLQGSEIAPVAYGSRAVACVWWFFALVITSSYTANLATLLAKKTSNEIIQSVTDLAYNDLGISYGAKAGGSTYTFFEHSQSEIYQKMFQHMQGQKMPKDNDEGVKKVMEENYAFLMESTTIEYVVQRNCRVYMVGDLLDSRGYGIAMRKDSPYRQALNLALLRLQESGTLREMKHVWWEERHGGGACKDEGEHSSEKLEMNSFYGLFMVLAVGCVLGIMLSCGDLAWLAWRQPRDPAASFRRNFLHELRFVFRFELSAKPLTGPLLPPPESESAGSSLRTELEEGSDGGREDRAEAEGEPEGGEGRGSVMSGPLRRRRSSMHTASVRLARHAHQPPRSRKQSLISAATQR